MDKELEERMSIIEEKLDIILEELFYPPDDLEEEEVLVRVPFDVYRKIEEFIGEEPVIMGIS